MIPEDPGNERILCGCERLPESDTAAILQSMRVTSR
jgi:hypothetical protein